MRSRENYGTWRILANHVFDPPAWQEIDWRISERLALSIEVKVVHIGDRTPEGRTLGKLERGLLQECR